MAKVLDIWLNLNGRHGHIHDMTTVYYIMTHPMFYEKAFLCNFPQRIKKNKLFEAYTNKFNWQNI